MSGARSLAFRARPLALRARLLARGLVLLVLLAGCAARVPASIPTAPVVPLRLHEVAGDGDATRRASLRFVLQGLSHDAQGQARLANTSYERALQIDVNNPFAYLALARQAVEAGDGASALEYLEQAELLLGAEDLRSPRVEPHLAGLRGAALLEQGDEANANKLLARASTLAPTVWSDGRLSAVELR